MMNQENMKRLAYSEALRALPDLSEALKAVFTKATDENLSFEDAAQAIGTEDALIAAYHLRRILTYTTLLPFYYEELIEKLYTDYWLDNDNEDYINE
jgi:ABC-type microcin C transport system permease subunit YejE